MIQGVQVLVKREECNQFGTVKDRPSFLTIADAVSQGIRKLACITWGNHGKSLAGFAEGTGIKIHTLVDPAIASSVKDALRLSGATVLETDLSQHLSSEEVIARVRSHTPEKIWDVTNGWEERGYDLLAEEIAPLFPGTIVCPVGSGGLLWHLHQGLVRRGIHPHCVGVGVEHQPSIADKLVSNFSPYTARLQSLQQQGHLLFRLTEDEIRRGIALVPEGIESESSAAVVFAIIERIRDCAGPIVVINTGKGII